MAASWHRTERRDTAPQGRGWRRIAPVHFLPILLSFLLAQELMDCRHSGTHRNHPYRHALPGSPKPPSTVSGPTNPTLQFQHISPGGFRWNQSPSHQHHRNSLLEEMNTPHEPQHRGPAWNIHLVFGKKCFSTQKKKKKSQLFYKRTGEDHEEVSGNRVRSWVSHPGWIKTFGSGKEGKPDFYISV